MSHILKISEAASIAIHTMALMASDPSKLWTTGKIASFLSVSENHLSKVMQRLVKEGVVISVRGPAGGFKPLKNIDEITLLDVYEAIEGKLLQSHCLLNPANCCGSKCVMGNLLKEVDELVRDYLLKTKLSDLTETYGCRKK